MFFINNAQLESKKSKNISKNQIIKDTPLSNKTKKKYAFTLAEILIVLTIIGVVASLTVPVVLNNISQAELKTAFKKNYSVINQATRLILINDTPNFKNLCNNDDNNCLANFYKKYLNVVKICSGNSGEFLGNCWHQDGEWNQLNGPQRMDGDDGNTGLILSSGAFLNIHNTDLYCDEDESIPSAPGTFLVCAEMTIDVNGFKKPNVIGKDIYFMSILEKQLRPGGDSGSSYNLNDYPCNTSNAGWGCAASVLIGN